MMEVYCFPSAITRAWLVVASPSFLRLCDLRDFLNSGWELVMSAQLAARTSRGRSSASPVSRLRTPDRPTRPD